MSQNSNAINYNKSICLKLSRVSVVNFTFCNKIKNYWRINSLSVIYWFRSSLIPRRRLWKASGSGQAEPNSVLPVRWIRVYNFLKRISNPLNRIYSKDIRLAVQLHSSLCNVPLAIYLEKFGKSERNLIEKNIRNKI